MVFPTDGSQLKLQQSLAPYKAYRIIITSPYNLKPAYSEARGNFIGDFQIEGTNLKATYTNETSDGYISHLEFVYRGTGKPITIGLANNHSKEIVQANVTIRSEGWYEAVFREYLKPFWERYDIHIISTLLIVPGLYYLWIYFLRRRQHIRVFEKKAELKKQSLVLNSHTKSLELMREIDKKAQQKADELMQRNYDELQARVVFWRTRAYTESYFLNPDLRKNFVFANRERILTELEPLWSDEMMEIAQDLTLVKQLQEHEPGVLQWLQARHEVIGMAHKLTWLPDTSIEADFEEVQDTFRVVVVDDADIHQNETKRQRRKAS